MRYLRPESLDEALAIAGDGALVAAGCTDLFPATDRQALRPRDGQPILDITRTRELHGIARTSEGLRIGATTTWTSIARANLPPACDALKQAAVEVGSRQIQNAGTVGGNLCNASPAADGVPPLLALDALVELRKTSGARILKLQEFIEGPRKTALEAGELLTAIWLPKPALEGRSLFLKLGARRHLVISIVMTAVRLVEEQGTIRRAAVAVGSAGPVATRLTVVEDGLTGLAYAPSAFVGVAQSDVSAGLAPISDIRADAEYRDEAAFILVRRAVQRLTERQA